MSKHLRYGSVCSGIEAATAAWRHLGWKPSWFSEIDPFACSFLTHRFPETPNLGDMTSLAEKVLARQVDAPDILCGGTPCFVAGTKVLCEFGYKNIEDIRPGDKVVSHTGKLCSVLRIGNKVAPVGALHAVGHTPIICTPDHPIQTISRWARTLDYGRPSHRRSFRFGEPVWTPAKDSTGLLWTTPMNYGRTWAHLKKTGLGWDLRRVMYFFGVYCRYGFTYFRKDKYDELEDDTHVRLCAIPSDEAVKLQSWFDPAVRIEIEEAGRRISHMKVFDEDLVDLISRYFPETDWASKIPAWVLAHPERHCFLDGLATEGNRRDDGSIILYTLDESFAYGIVDLMTTLGYTASAIYRDFSTTMKALAGESTKGGTFTVAGRPRVKRTRSYETHGYLCRVIKRWQDLEREDTVYNIEVSGDHSYIVAGMCVHNCHAAGTLVLTSKGYTPIEDIEAGDMVVTHMGRLRKVIRTGVKFGYIGTMTGCGMRGIECTSDHKYLGCRVSVSRENRTMKLVNGDTEWMSAKSMVGNKWAALTHFEDVEQVLPTFDFVSDREKLVFLLGLFFCMGRKTEDELGNPIAEIRLRIGDLRKFKGMFAGSNFTVRTTNHHTYRVGISEAKLVSYLESEIIGEKGFKRIPVWVLGDRDRHHFADAILETRSSRGPSKSTIVTFNDPYRALAVSDLFLSLGWVSSVREATFFDEAYMEKPQPVFRVRLVRFTANAHAAKIGNYLLRRVNGYDNRAERVPVFNIEVEQDHSYIAEGIVSSNCQAFSSAGLKKSLDDPRGNLSLVFCQIANAIDSVRTSLGQPPAIVFWENVPGVLSTKDNAFGCFIGALAGSESPVVCRGKFPNAGVVQGEQRTVAWRVLDSQYFGVPQRRRRVYVVASAPRSRGGCINPAEVLFEPASLSGSAESGKDKQETPAGNAQDSSRTDGDTGTCFPQRSCQGNDTVGVLTVSDLVKQCSRQAVTGDLLLTSWIRDE